MKFDNLDDVLQHHGVKGMKWGVIRNRKPLKDNRVVKAIATRHKNQVRKSRESEKRYHEKRMMSNGNAKYKKEYRKNLRKYKGNETKARSITVRKQKRGNQKILLTAVYMSPAAINTGKLAARAIRSAATSPENIRRGKNVVQALRRTGVRYVDGSQMRNVVGSI